MLTNRELANFQHFMTTTPPNRLPAPRRSPKGAYDSASHLTRRDFGPGGAYDVAHRRKLAFDDVDVESTSQPDPLAGAVATTPDEMLTKVLKFVQPKLSAADWKELTGIISKDRDMAADARIARGRTAMDRFYARNPDAKRIGHI
jgi:hypothetical protein